MVTHQKEEYYGLEIWHFFVRRFFWKIYERQNENSIYFMENLSHIFISLGVRNDRLDIMIFLAETVLTTISQKYLQNDL